MVEHNEAEPRDGTQKPTGSDSGVEIGEAAEATGSSDSITAQRAQQQSALSSLPDLRQTLSDDPGLDDDQSETSREEFTTVYDIIDHLEQTLDEAKGSIFYPSQARVNRDDFNEQLATLKGMLPVQLERASALMREAERRLENAQSQASAIVSSAQSRAAETIKEAQDQAQFLASQENVTDLARQQARVILDQAQAKSERLTRGADDYCAKVMHGLQEQLGKLSQDVNAGIEVLDERRKTAAEDYGSGMDFDDDVLDEDK